MIEWLERAPKERPKDEDIVKDLSQYWVCCPHCGRKGSFGGEISRKNTRIRIDSYKGLWYAQIASYQGHCSNCGSTWIETNKVPGTTHMRKITKRCMIPITIILVLICVIVFSSFQAYEMFTSHPEGITEVSDKNRVWACTFIGICVNALIVCGLIGVTIRMILDYKKRVKNGEESSIL